MSLARDVERFRDELTNEVLGDVPFVFDLKKYDRRNQFISLTIRGLVSVCEQRFSRLSHFLLNGRGRDKKTILPESCIAASTIQPVPPR